MLLAWLSPHFQETGSFSCCHNSHRFLQPEILRLYFAHAGNLGCSVCLTPQLFLPVYLHANVKLPISSATPCRMSSLLKVPVSTPPRSLDKCFFFNSSVVRLPYSSIFWQLWLFFVFKFTVVLFLFLQGGKVYLPMPPSWPETTILIYINKK